MYKIIKKSVTSALRNPSVHLCVLGAAIICATASFFYASVWSIKRGWQEMEYLSKRATFILPAGFEKRVREIFLRGTPSTFTVKIKKETRKRLAEDSCIVILAHSAPASCCAAGNLLIAAMEGKCDIVKGLTGENPLSDLGLDELTAGFNILRERGMPLVLYSVPLKVKKKLRRTGIGFFDNAVFLPFSELQKMSAISLSRDDVNDLTVSPDDFSFAIADPETKVCSHLPQGLVCIKGDELTAGLFERLETAINLTSRASSMVLAFLAAFIMLLNMYLLKSVMPEVAHLNLYALPARRIYLHSLVAFSLALAAPSLLFTLFGAFASFLMANAFSAGYSIPYIPSLTDVFSLTGLWFAGILPALVFFLHRVHLELYSLRELNRWI